MDVPWPTMMLERIGTIGNTQGVNASRSPNPKNTAATQGRAPSRINRETVHCQADFPLDWRIADAVLGAALIAHLQFE